MIAALPAAVEPLSRAAARAAARRELAKPAYHRDDPSLAVRALRAVGRLVSAAFDGAASASPARLVAVAVLLAVLAALLVGLRRRLGPLARSPRRAAVLSGGGAASAAEHRSRAEAAAAAGRLGEAVRERLRALARELEEQHVLVPRDARTAAELATEAGQRLPAADALLHRAAAVFDEVTYGGRTATLDDVAAVVAADDAVRRTVRRTVRRAARVGAAA